MVPAARAPVWFVFLSLSIALASVPAGDATHQVGCSAASGEILLGAGPEVIGIPALHGITYLDFAHPSCSSGRFFIDHTTPGVSTIQDCDNRVLRVYAPVGTSTVEVVVQFTAGSPSQCL